MNAGRRRAAAGASFGGVCGFLVGDDFLSIGVFLSGEGFRVTGGVFLSGDGFRGTGGEGFPATDGFGSIDGFRACKGRDPVELVNGGRRTAETVAEVVVVLLARVCPVARLVGCVVAAPEDVGLAGLVAVVADRVTVVEGGYRLLSFFDGSGCLVDTVRLSPDSGCLVDAVFGTVLAVFKALLPDKVELALESLAVELLVAIDVLLVAVDALLVPVVVADEVLLLVAVLALLLTGNRLGETWRWSELIVEESVDGFRRVRERDIEDIDGR